MNSYYKNSEATKHVFDEEGKKFNQLSSTIMVQYGNNRKCYF